MHFNHRWKRLLVLLMASLILGACGDNTKEPPASMTSSESSAATSEAAAVSEAPRPVVFVHGEAGSAAQFESQAQRFLANGYTLADLGVYEYDAGLDPDEQIEANNAGIDATIDRRLQETGADAVDLIGYGMGARVIQHYLSLPHSAAKVAHYANLNGDETASEAFFRMYLGFTGVAPATSDIPPSEADQIRIAGRAVIFPGNTGAAGCILKIYALHPETGLRVDPEAPLAEWTLPEDGVWGPVAVAKGVPYEFVLAHDDQAMADDLFFREPFRADNYFIRLHASGL